MLYVNPVRLVRKFTVASGGWQNRRIPIVSRDRVLDFFMKVGTTVLIAAGMIIGVLVLWAAIIFVSIWSLFFMLSYL
jgi:hypothetical protein